jgi:hypothetical protein
MKYLLILVVAIGGYFAWKKFARPEPETITAPDPNKTTGADVQNRINSRTGFVDP